MHLSRVVQELSVAVYHRGVPSVGAVFLENTRNNYWQSRQQNLRISDLGVGRAPLFLVWVKYIDL